MMRTARLLLVFLVLPTLAWSQAQIINGNRVHAGWVNYGTTAGSATAYTLTFSPALPGYVPGQCFLVKPHVTNTGAATLNVQGKGALALTKLSGGSLVPLVAGDLLLNRLVWTCYDGTNFQLMGTAPDAGAGGVTDGDKGDLTVTGAGTIWTIDPGAVTYAKLPTATAGALLLGRTSTGAGAWQEITLGTNLAMSGTTLNAAGAGGVVDGDKGDLTVSVGGTIWTIDPNAVTYAKLQQTATPSVLLGRGAGSAGTPQEITLGTNLSMSGTTLNAASGTAALGYVNVKNAPYNAVGNGVADDTAAIQAALNANAGMVFFPVGVYSVTTLTVPNFVTLFGAGPGLDVAGNIGAVLEQRNGVNASLINGICATGIADYWHGGQVVNLRLRKAAGSTDTSGSGIEINCRSGELLRFRDLLIQDFPHDGIWFRHGGTNLSLNMISTHRNGRYGINITKETGDVYQVVTLKEISGDANALALINISPGGGAGDTWHLSDIKAEAVGSDQLTIVRLDTLNGSPVYIENLVGSSISGATTAQVVHVVGSSARVYLTNVRCQGCTNLITDASTSTVVPYAGTAPYWLAHTFGRLMRLDSNGLVTTPTIGNVVNAAANNLTLDTLKRFTDTAPTGHFQTFQTAAGTPLWNVDISGNLTAGTVPTTALTGTLSDTQIPHLNTLSTGLTPSRCVETDAAGLLVSTGALCGTGGTGVTDGDKTDITVSGTGTIWTIDPGTVTLAKLAPMATASLLGRTTAGTGTPEVLAGATARTLLGISNVDNTSDAAKNAATATLSNKRVTKKLLDAVDATPIAINYDTYNRVRVDELSQATTFSIPTWAAPPDDGDFLEISIFCTSARALTFTTGTNGFSAGHGIGLPTTCRAGGWVTYGFLWLAGTSKWEHIATTQTVLPGYVHLPVGSVIQPTSQAARIDGSGNNIRLLFDATTSQCAWWQFRMPPDYAGSPVFKWQYVMVSDNNATHSVFLDIALMAVTPGDAGNADTDSYASTVACNDAAIPSTVGQLDELSCPITSDDGLAGGDLVRLKICRNVSDTATGDLGGVAAMLQYTR